MVKIEKFPAQHFLGKKKKNIFFFFIFFFFCYNYRDKSVTFMYFI